MLAPVESFERLSVPTPAFVSRTRAAIPSAAKSPSWPSTASSASSSAPRSSRLRARATAMSARRGSSSDASRSDSSSPAASSSSAREGTSESNSSSTFAFGTAPTNSLTTLPSSECLHSRDSLHPVAGGECLVGVDVDLGEHDLAVAGPHSAASSAGVRVRHGPHHSAQKSTTTGTWRERSITSDSKVASVTSMAMA